jgi:hypothetical protein
MTTLRVTSLGVITLRVTSLGVITSKAKIILKMITLKVMTLKVRISKLTTLKLTTLKLTTLKLTTPVSLLAASLNLKGMRVILEKGLLVVRVDVEGCVIVTAGTRNGLVKSKVPLSAPPGSPKKIGGSLLGIDMMFANCISITEGSVG